MATSISASTSICTSISTSICTSISIIINKWLFIIINLESNNKHMVASAILPVAMYKNKLHFLFGKENPNEESAPGWSDFGGRIEKGETPYQAALREGSEELSGFLGNEKQLKSLIRKNGGTIIKNKQEIHKFINA